MFPRRDIGGLIGVALWRWGLSARRRMAWVAARTCNLGLAEARRRVSGLRIGGRVPWVVAISPTMSCNYDCGGCYSRGRSEEDELTTHELDELFAEAEELGVLAFVVTGGEPLLRDGLVEIMSSHPKLLFVLITNGSLVTDDVARVIASSGNMIPLVSIEGLKEDTDGRRRPGAHDTAVTALERFEKAGACFGFAAMNTTENLEHSMSDAFIDAMERLGCSLGFLTEYVPTDAHPRSDWLLSDEARSALRDRVLELRRARRIVLVQFPHDEYGPDNRCTAAGAASLHISSRGAVEPCPFVAVSCDNVRQGGLAAACRSRFLREIRKRPDLLRRARYGCSLFEHRAEVERLAAEIRAEADSVPAARHERRRSH